MANPIAVPGTNVPSGAAVSPGGAQGLTGTPAWTTCTSSFTIPAVGSTVSVPVVDTSWITTGEMIYVDQAGGGVGLSGVLQVTAKAGNTLTLLNPTPAPAIPPADMTQAGLLKQLSGNTTDFVDGTNTCQNLVNAVQPTIWSARLRSFNAIGNPTFEVDQRNAGNSNPNIANNVFALDRYQNVKSAASTFTYSAIQGLQTFANGNLVVPGTNFRITNNFLNTTLQTQQATLAAGDYALYQQVVEGPRLRELAGDVHSISIFCQTNVAGGLKFSIALRDPTGTRSLVKLCTIPAANTLTLISLPNLPVWPSAGTFSVAPGAAGYFFNICFACGSTFTAPAADTWQNGNFLGAPGMDNFCSKPVNSNLLLFFIQHEPGALCTTPIDCPFGTNLDGDMGCLRYYCKSYDYGALPGTITATGSIGLFSATGQGGAFGPIRWPKPMAKAPTVTIYNHATGAAGSVRDGLGVDHASATGSGQNIMGMYGIAFSTATTGPVQTTPHFTADTGW